MKSNKQKTFEEWMDEDSSGSVYEVMIRRGMAMSIPRYNFAKEVWAAAGGKFKSDEVNDEAN